MSLTVTDIAPRIVQPSTYLKKTIAEFKSTFCSKLDQYSSENQFRTNWCQHIFCSIDTKLNNISGFYKFIVYWKSANLPSPWTSKIPKCYKRNTINDGLHR